MNDAPMFVDDLDPTEVAIVDTLQSVEGWPADHGKDVALVRRLVDTYQYLDVLAEAVSFAAWMGDHQQKKKIKHRARFANWVKNADGYRRTRTQKGSRHRTAAAGGYGSSVRVSDGW